MEVKAFVKHLQRIEEDNQHPHRPTNLACVEWLEEYANEHIGALDARTVNELLVIVRRILDV